MNVMTSNLPHIAGLNPKGFLTIRQNREGLLRNLSRGSVGGDLVGPGNGVAPFRSFVSDQSAIEKQSVLVFG